MKNISSTQCTVNNDMEQTVVIFNTESKLYSVVDLNISKEIWVRVPYIGSVVVALYCFTTKLYGQVEHTFINNKTVHLKMQVFVCSRSTHTRSGDPSCWGPDIESYKTRRKESHKISPRRDVDNKPGAQYKPPVVVPGVLQLSR